MLPFLLHFSIGLVSASVFSTLLVVTPHIRHRNKETLPISRSEEYVYVSILLKLEFLILLSRGYVSEEEDEQELLTGVRDPFDIVKSEDTSDGNPIDERQFWRKARVVRPSNRTVVN